MLGGLKFETHAGIGQKEAFFKSFKMWNDE
jgi:hypothetical protein